MYRRRSRLWCRWWSGLNYKGFTFESGLDWLFQGLGCSFLVFLGVPDWSPVLIDQLGTVFEFQILEVLLLELIFVSVLLYAKFVPRWGWKSMRRRAGTGSRPCRNTWVSIFSACSLARRNWSTMVPAFPDNFINQELIYANFIEGIFITSSMTTFKALQIKLLVFFHEHSQKQRKIGLLWSFSNLIMDDDKN